MHTSDFWPLLLLRYYSALVGFGILAILTPVPTYVGQLLLNVHKEKMKAVSTFATSVGSQFDDACCTDGYASSSRYRK